MIFTDDTCLAHPQRTNVGETKVLGVKWHPSTDCLVFDFKDTVTRATNGEPTKRHVIGMASSFYNPIGLVSPVTIQFKILFQELCQAKLDCDDPLPPELQHRWHDLMSSLQRSQAISIPRCYLIDETHSISSCRLCGFCDASKKPYATVVYVLVSSNSGHYASLQDTGFTM